MRLEFVDIQSSIMGRWFNRRRKISLMTTNKYNSHAVFDTGTPWTHVSPSDLKSIAKTIGAHYCNDAGAYMLRCPSGYASTPFDFNGFIMNIPLSSFEASYTEDPCVLTVLPKPSTMIRLPESTLQGNSAGKVMLSSFRKTLNGIMDYDIATY